MASDGAVTGVSSQTVTSTAAADEAALVKRMTKVDGIALRCAPCEWRRYVEEPALTGGAASSRALAASGSKQAGAAPSASDSDSRSP